MEKLVSIIIPTYKRNTNLERAIESILKQTYQKIEIIIVDDNNPDTEFRKNNEKMMKKYESNDTITYIKHEKNRNGAAARNTGIQMAKGEYIGFLDDDDEFLPTKLQKQVEFLENNKKYNCVGCQIYRNNKLEKQKIDEKTLQKDILSLKVSPITSTLLFRSNIIRDLKGFNEQYRRHQDVEIMVRYLENNKFGYLQEPLIVMGLNNGENQLIGEKLDKLKEQFITEFMPVIEQLDKEHQGAKKEILCSHYVGITINHLKNKNYKLLKKVMKKAFGTYPITYLVDLIKSIIRRIIIHLKWRKE